VANMSAVTFSMQETACLLLGLNSAVGPAANEWQVLDHAVSIANDSPGVGSRR